VFVRFRRSRGIEREQTKWFVFAVSLTAVGAGSLYLFDSVFEVSGWLDEVIYALEIVAFSSIPVAIGIAILRYRLYDIDLLIRRTLAYSLLTAALALVYFASVAILQTVFTLGVSIDPLQGSASGRQSPVVIVLSTLAIAGLFAPLRRRAQALIDRRFYRRKFDATRMLAEFGATARDETDLDRLASQLVMVIEEAIQPAHASLWIRPMEDKSK
jgi:hypothetical protein